MNGAAGDQNANENAITAWDTILFDKYVRFKQVIVRGCSDHGRVAMKRLGSLDGKRIVDLGCGFGGTTQELAGRAGEVVGIDASPRFIHAAAEESRAAKIANASFRVVDIESGELGGPYDLAFSQMGVMFFASPVRALRNVRSALVPGTGRVCLNVWRKREDNPWVHTAERIVKELVPPREEDKTDAVTCGPGPFSMSGPDLVSDQLIRAGFETIAFERCDLDLYIGKDVDEAISFALALGPAGEVIRLAGEEGERRRPAITAALRDAFAPYIKDDGLYAPSSTWIVTATV